MIANNSVLTKNGQLISNHYCQTLIGCIVLHQGTEAFTVQWGGTSEPLGWRDYTDVTVITVYLLL